MKTTLMLVAGLTLMACAPSAPPAQTTGSTASNETAAPVAPQSEVTPPAAPPSSDAPTPPTTIPTDPNADTCNKAQYAALVGKPATDPGVPAAGRTVRLIHPGDKVTMDFSPTRLNVHIDAKGVVTELRCG